MTEWNRDKLLAGLLPEQGIMGDSDEDTAMLVAMAERARQWLSGFSWCDGVRACFFGVGVGDLVAVFLLEIRPGDMDVDPFVWVVVGDIPPAYIRADENENPIEALEGYVYEMHQWVAAVLNGSPTDELIPVDAAPTEAAAEALQSRLQFIEDRLIPKFRDLWNDRQA